MIAKVSTSKRHPPPLPIFESGCFRCYCCCWVVWVLYIGLWYRIYRSRNIMLYTWNLYVINQCYLNKQNKNKEVSTSKMAISKTHMPTTQLDKKPGCISFPSHQYFLCFRDRVDSDNWPFGHLGFSSFFFFSSLTLIPTLMF